MFGIGKTKTEKMVLKLERVMMSIESAYEKEKYDIARFGVQNQLSILHWLNLEGEWSEERVTRYLKERGLVRSISDEAYCNEIAEKLMVF